MSKLKLQATDGSAGTVSLKAPASTTGNAEFELTLPGNAGSNGQLLSTNGSGVLTWSNDANVGGATGVDFNDNVKARWGTGNDLEIYHDGTNSLIENGTGNILIRGKTGENSIAALPDGAVKLFYDDSQKLATTSGGVELSGNLYLVDNDKAYFGTGGDFQIYHDASNSIIKQEGTGNLFIQAQTEKMAAFNCNAGVELYHNNVKTFETTSTGISVTGSVIASSNVQIGDSDEFVAGAGNDLRLWHDGTNSYIKNYTGDLYIQGDGDDLYLRASDNLTLYTQTSDQAVNCTGDAGVELYYDNAKRFETYASGVLVTGNLKSTGNTYIGNLVDSPGDSSSGHLYFGASNDLTIYHDGTDSWIDNVTGDVVIKNIHNNSDDIWIRTTDDFGVQVNKTESGLFVYGNGGVELYYDNSKKLETTSSGVKMPDSAQFELGDGSDFRIYHNGTNNYCQGYSGEMYYGTVNSGQVNFLYGNGVKYWYNGTAFGPYVNNSFDLGTSNYRWRNIYTNDLNLSNEGGDGNSVDGTTGNWTIQEGADNLFIVNNKNGKKFKIALQEVS